MKNSQKFCSVRATVDMIGGKWKLPIIAMLQDGTFRFKELLTAIDGITGRMLSKDLKDLEAHGLLTRTVYPEVPPRVEYALTDKGQSLKELVQAIKAWGEKHG